MDENNRLLNEITRLGNIIKATNIGTWEWEVQTGNVIFNSAWAEIIGYTLNDISQSIDSWYKFTHPDDLEKAQEKLDLVFSKKLPVYEIEMRMKHKNGNWVWILDKGEVISWDADGKPLLMVGSHTNITKVKEATLELELLAERMSKSEFLLRSSIESLKDIIVFSIDKNYCYYFFNQAHQESMKIAYNATAKVGESILNIINVKEDKDKAKRNYDLALSGVRHTNIEVFGDEEKLYYESFFNPIYNDKNEVIGASGFARNITTRVNAVKELESKKAELQLILDSAAVGIYGVDNEDICTFVNNSFLKLLGYEESEVIGKDMHKLLHETYLDGTLFPVEDCFLRRSFKEGIVVKEDSFAWNKNGTSIKVAYTSAPQITDGKIVGAVVSIKDISEREKLVSDLIYSRDIAQMYLDVAGVMLLVLDLKGNVTLINEMGCGILEADEEDILGKNWFDTFLPKENKKAVKKVFNDVLNKKNKVAINFENEIILASGKKKIINFYNAILYDAYGNVSGVLSSGEDVTEKRRNEIALQESNERFRVLFEKAPLGYQSLDINGCFREINNTWTELLGYKKEEVIGKWFGDFLTEEYRKPFKERFELFKQEGRIHSEFEMLHKNGSRLFIEFEGMIGYNDNHQFLQTYCNLNDVTKRKLVQDKLSKSEENLKLAQSIAKIGSWELDLVNGSMWASKEAFNIYELEGNNEFVELELIQNMVDLEERKKLDEALNDLIECNKPYDETFRLITMTKKVKYINSRANLIKDSNNKPLKVVGVIHDITDLKLKELELEYAAYNDFLTGLSNRRYYEENLLSFDVANNYPLTIVMADINGLKLINDAFGHSSGDKLLVSAAKLISESCSEKDLVARIGGDEFVILMPNTNTKKAEQIINDINEKAKSINIQSIPLSISFGYKTKKNLYDDIHDVYRGAEDLMYREKLIEIPSMRSGAIETILSTLYEKDKNSEIHSRSVSILSERIAKAYGMNRQDISEVKTAGLLHDIGKIIIPTSIINKNGKLTEEEYEAMKNHPEIGFRILNSTQNMREISNIVLNHHERWDGKGYPRGIKSNHIPLKSRIIAIADSFDAMTSERTYRDILSNQEALKEVLINGGKQFDPDLVKVFNENFEDIVGGIK